MRPLRTSDRIMMFAGRRRVESIPGVLATLTLQDYGRFARYSGTNTTLLAKATWFVDYLIRKLAFDLNQFALATQSS